MPVLDSNPHDLTKRTHADPYTCKDREIKQFYPKKQLLLSDDGSKYEWVDTMIEHKMSTDCRVDSSLTDPRCRTCKWKGNGVEYSRKIREQ